MYGFDVFDSDVSVSDVSDSDVSNRIRVNLDGLNMEDIEVGGLCDSDDSGRSKNSLKEAVKQYGQHYKEKFIADPDYSLTSLQQDVKRYFPCLVSLTECKRAKVRVLELLEGVHKAQYEKIYEYFLEIRTQNVRTTTICYLDNRLFQWMYVCLQACKDGYKVGCRRIIGLDGCFLKGFLGGYLLAAIRIDANNGIYPIVYATIESENQASWLWFLKFLALDLEIVCSYQISFMSYK
ncbi:hypothetical protein PVK06_024059 [Gossypium arboreum]|uniref:MULE transposase domain-containing protein n=1 Tax=Gossypium arboreum TaxID=29729 RepID=A0ABR0PD51_GOSAR|nr:hypothetical protein PVK06_024059 [Gossypium arboreum]